MHRSLEVMANAVAVDKLRFQTFHDTARQLAHERLSNLRLSRSRERQKLSALPNDILAVLRRGGLLELGVVPTMQPLSGGVSSDIWRVDLAAGAFCVKRALPKLRVAADWQAPVERNAYEAAWMAVVADIVPDAVPPVLHSDVAGHALVMPFLDPERYRGYKSMLLAGQGERWMAEIVADRLVRIHNTTAKTTSLAKRFATDRIFHDIRIEPYLLATAQRHPSLAHALREIAAVTAQTKLALVHGDISPKNILIGESGILFLDAECAWWGDPAFDLAFCLNHFLLKTANRPAHAFDHLDFFEVMAETYLTRMRFEDRSSFEARGARLLPALTLGRIDGRSPVEYITDEALKQRVRELASDMIKNPVDRFADIQNRWLEAFAT